MSGAAGQPTPADLADVQAAPVPGHPGWSWGFEGERTAAGVPLLWVRTPDGAWAGETTRLGLGRWASTAVVEGEAEQAEQATLDAALRWVAATARV